MSINSNFIYGVTMRWVIKNIIFLLCIVCGIVIPVAAYSAEPVQLSVTWNYSANIAGVAGFRLYSANNLICETSDPVARELTCAVVVQSQSMAFAMTAYDVTGSESAASDLFWVDFGQAYVPADTPPTAYITANPVYGVAPLRVNFDGSKSVDTDGTIVVYAWDFSDGEQATVSSPTHAFSVPGVYTVSLVVTDNKGNKARAESMVTVVGAQVPANKAPSAVLTSSGKAGTAPLVVSFSGSGSSDTDGTIASYAWTFGDGSTGSGVTPSHTYSAAGNYTATLTVTDNAGATAQAQTVITLQAPSNQEPVAVLKANLLTGTAPLVVSFDGSSSSDPDGTIASYAWTFGDGYTARGANTSHTYMVAGNNRVTLVVTDDKGNSAKAESLVTVDGNAPGQGTPGNLPPTAVIAVKMPAVDSGSLRASFDGGKSSDGDGTIAVYRWDFGDGESGAGALVSHTYGEPGTYAVTLVVADNDGLTGLARQEIILSALPPVQPSEVPQDNVVTDSGGTAAAASGGGGGCSVLQHVGEGAVGLDWLLSLIFINAVPLVARLRKKSGASL